MFVLSLAWAGLVVVEVVWGLSPLLEGTATVLWIVFLIEFLLKWMLAPHNLAYLGRTWLTILPWRCRPCGSSGWLAWPKCSAPGGPCGDWRWPGC